MSGLPDSPATRKQQFRFLHEAHQGPATWHALCLQLTREAAQLPPVHPTALAAAYATPQHLRVYKVENLRRGMALFYDDPTDSNPAGHVVTGAGWKGREPGEDLHGFLTVTNDAIRDGGVDWVRGDFFPEHWGDTFLFGAPCLNGYDLPGYTTGRTQPADQRAALTHAVAAIRKEVAYQRTHGTTRLVRALTRDLAALKADLKKLG